MLSTQDIGAMKMNAIHINGGRIKDFADIHKLLEKDSLSTYLDYTRRKYPEVIPLNLKRFWLINPTPTSMTKFTILESESSGTKWRTGFARLTVIRGGYSARFNNLKLTSESQNHPVSEEAFDQDNFLSREE